MSTSATISLAIVIALNGIVLHNRAADGQFNYVFECVDTSTTADEMFKKVTRQLAEMSFDKCSLWKTPEIGAALSQSGGATERKYHVYYTCREGANCYLPFDGPRCSPENQCLCCRMWYSLTRCQYEIMSLNRFWNACTPFYDEESKTLLETIESVDDSNRDSLYGLIRDPDSIARSVATDRPYCNDGKLSMVIHPCCEPPLMLVVDKVDCLQKVLCGTRLESGIPFKFFDSDSRGATIGSWTGPLNDAWDRLPAWPKIVFSRVMHKLVACMNATDRVSVADTDQCNLCKAPKEVVRLYEMGNTVVL
ncbi:uncharacterized protein LOC129581123 [Paramacrobiotus metropolitanus]|uniref:uncharacterized protein LOC129581123 n=1 Tax=Paramacrobiotus metropolitanus TaxID=2943436 RepID=UPI002445D072|nr:uncharacterized protein LOC129581123 [Paramacrobiotus metropolitanus]